MSARPAVGRLNWRVSYATSDRPVQLRPWSCYGSSNRADRVARRLVKDRHKLFDVLAGVSLVRVEVQHRLTGARTFTWEAPR